MKNETEHTDLLKKLPKELQEFLKENNDLRLFNGGLHVRGICNKPKWNSLKLVWVGEAALHKTYNNLEETDIPFGQDCLGDQFILRKNVVYKLFTETGDLQSFDVDFNTFIRLSKENPIEYLSLEPLLLYEKQGKKLKPGQLLNVYPPFCTKESQNGISLKAVPAMERLDFLVSFYKQLFNILNGDTIKLHTGF